MSVRAALTAAWKQHGGGDLRPEPEPPPPAEKPADNPPDKPPLSRIEREAQRRETFRGELRAELRGENSAPLQPSTKLPINPGAHGRIASHFLAQLDNAKYADHQDGGGRVAELRVPDEAPETVRGKRVADIRYVEHMQDLAEWTANSYARWLRGMRPNSFWSEQQARNADPALAQKYAEASKKAERQRKRDARLAEVHEHWNNYSKTPETF
jgi:hypothetical protein